MEELIRARLASSIASVPADWGMSAQGISVPRLVLYKISGGADYTSTGSSGYRRARIQIDCYGASVGAAKLLSRQVISCLSGWKSGEILGVFLDNDRDFPPDAEGASLIARVALDFFVHHQEA